MDQATGPPESWWLCQQALSVIVPLTNGGGNGSPDVVVSVTLYDGNRNSLARRSQRRIALNIPWFGNNQEHN